MGEARPRPSLEGRPAHRLTWRTRNPRSIDFRVSEHRTPSTQSIRPARDDASGQQGLPGDELPARHSPRAGARRRHRATARPVWHRQAGRRCGRSHRRRIHRLGHPQPRSGARGQFSRRRLGDDESRLGVLHHRHRHTRLPVGVGVLALRPHPPRPRRRRPGVFDRFLGRDAVRRRNRHRHHLLGPAGASHLLREPAAGPLRTCIDGRREGRNGSGHSPLGPECMGDLRRGGFDGRLRLVPQGPRPVDELRAGSTLGRAQQGSGVAHHRQPCNPRDAVRYRRCARHRCAADRQGRLDRLRLEPRRQHPRADHHRGPDDRHHHLRRVRCRARHPLVVQHQPRARDRSRSVLLRDGADGVPDQHHPWCGRGVLREPSGHARRDDRRLRGDQDVPLQLDGVLLGLVGQLGPVRGSVHCEDLAWPNDPPVHSWRDPHPVDHRRPRVHHARRHRDLVPAQHWKVGRGQRSRQPARPRSGILRGPESDPECELDHPDRHRDARGVLHHVVGFGVVGELAVLAAGQPEAEARHHRAVGRDDGGYRRRHADDWRPYRPSRHAEHGHHLCITVRDRADRHGGGADA